MPDEGADVAAVLAAEEARCRAIAEEDWDALSEIVGDDFDYTHSNATHQDKEAWIEGIKVRRREVIRDDLSVRLIGDVALVSGGTVYRYAEPFNGDSHFGVHLDVLQVFARRDGRWQVIAHHGVKTEER
jgi:Domain of unknown function (DUF4440)